MKFNTRKINNIEYVMPDNIFNWVDSSKIVLPEYNLITQIRQKFEQKITILPIVNYEASEYIDPRLIPTPQPVIKKGNMIDIGANVGYYSLTLAPYFENVYAFEPTPIAYNALCGGIALNGYTNVYAHQIAIGDDSQVGIQALQIVAEDAGGNSISNPLNTKKLGEISVQLRTLDSYNLETNFIKIDVEGNELETLKGAVNTIKKYKPFIAIEIWDKVSYADKRKQCLDYLDKLGYKCEKKECDVWFCTPIL